MDVQAALALFAGWIRTAAAEITRTWNALPAEWRAPAALVAGLGTVFGGILAWLKYRREHRPLDLALGPGKYIGHIPPDEMDVFPFRLSVTNRASAANSIVSVRFFVDHLEQNCAVLPLDLLGRPIKPYEALTADVVVKLQRLTDVNYRKVRFRVEQARGRTRTFTIKAGNVMSTY